MWFNERRRGPGWSASSRPQAAPLPPRPPSRAARPRPPPRQRLPPGRCLSWGLLRSPGRGAGRLRVSGSGVSGSRLPAGGRASAAAGAAPQEPPPRTVLSARAGGGGGGGGPLKSPARPPDPPAAAPLWSRPGCGKGAAPLRLGAAERRCAPTARAAAAAAAGKIHFLGPRALDASSFPS